MNAKLNMHAKVQETPVKAHEEQMRGLGRKAVLVYAGLLGMAYDATRDLFNNSMKLVDNAEQRGETLVHDVGEQVEMWRHKANTQMTDWGDRVEQQVQGATAKLNDEVKAVQQGVEKAIERLSEPVEEPPVVVEITEMVVAEPITSEPLAGYDEMTAKDVVEKLVNLGPDVLMLVRDYEIAHKNRVTVLNVIEEQLARMEPEEA